MQELKLYDPTREPQNWTEILRPGQYVVFHTNVHTDIEAKADGTPLTSGEESSCMVSDSLEEAEAYCESQVERIPNLRCEIYDHAGKSKPPSFTYVNKAFLKTPRKHAWWGWVLVAAGVPCFWIEWHWHGTLIVPTIAGINLVIAGLRMVYWGWGGTEKRRSKRER